MHLCSPCVNIDCFQFARVFLFIFYVIPHLKFKLIKCVASSKDTV